MITKAECIRRRSSAYRDVTCSCRCQGFLHLSMVAECDETVAGERTGMLVIKVFVNFSIGSTPSDTAQSEHIIHICFEWCPRTIIGQWCSMRIVIRKRCWGRRAVQRNDFVWLIGMQVVVDKDETRGENDGGNCIGNCGIRILVLIEVYGYLVVDLVSRKLYYVVYIHFGGICNSLRAIRVLRLLSTSQLLTPRNL